MDNKKKTFTTKDLRTKPPQVKSPPQPHQPNQPDNNHPVCFICATTNPAFWAVGPCGHPYCALCALRLRSILKTRCCPMCKSEHEQVFVAKSLDGITCQRSVFEDDQGLGMCFENGDARRLVLAMAAFSCSVCKKTVKGKKELQEHIELQHRKLLCELCLQFKPVFPLEQQLYDHRQSLTHHQTSKTGGHPQCTVCHDRFYSDDELSLHCRERHEQCFICARNPQTACYFADYPHLHRHFDTAHHVCRDPVCLEMRFVVFGSEMELRAHQRQVHFGQQKMQRSQQRLASRIQVPFGAGGDGGDGSVGAGSGGSRLNDHSNRRSDNHQRSRTNGTTNGTHQSHQSHQSHQQPIQQQQQQIPTDYSWFMFDPTGTQTHAQSMSQLLQSNKDFTKYLSDCRLQSKLDSLRQECRKFQRGTLSATQLVTHLYTQQFDVTAVSQRLLELLPERVKQVELQRAVEEHQRIQAAFPSLPASTSSGGVTASRGQAVQRMSEAPIRGRITPQTGTGRAPRPPANPARDPLALLGSMSLVGGSRAAGAVSGVSGVSVASSDFPSLPTHTQQQPKHTKQPKQGTNEQSNDSDDEVFTIGQQQHTNTTTDNTTTKKTKKQLLMRFGGFSNPYNDT